MSIGLLLLNGLKAVDFGFFIGCAVVIGLIIAVYFLIPVFNKKQYAEQRENLKKREAAFNANRRSTTPQEEDSLDGVEVQENLVNNVAISAEMDNISDVQIEAIEELQEIEGNSANEGEND